MAFYEQQYKIGVVMFRKIMIFIQQLTVTNWVTIFVMLCTAILIPLAIYFFKVVTKPKESVFFNEIEKNFSALNPQLRPQNVLSLKGKLSLNKIIECHKLMFQLESSKAGLLRNVEVYVVSKKISLPSNLPNETHKTSSETEKTNLYSPKEVKKALQNAIYMWNKFAVKKTIITNKSKVELLARFHTYFETIHPFLDGNGKLGRLILSEQCSYLFEKFVDFNPDANEYYNAVNFAVRGDETKLKELIIKEVSKGLSVT